MAWDKDKPEAGIIASLVDNRIRDNNDALEDGMNNEHDFHGTSAADQLCIHRQGSARCFYQATQPMTRIDTSAFTSVDLGSLWVDSGDGKIYILTAITPTWVAIEATAIATLLAAARVFASTLGVTGNFAVNTNMFNVAAATGNTLVAGTLGVTGIATIGKASLLASEDAPTSNAMIANKKYVNDQDTALIAGAGFWKHSGTSVFASGSPSVNTFADLNLSAVVGARRALVFLKVTSTSNDDRGYAFRTKGESADVAKNWSSDSGGCSVVRLDNNSIGYVIVETDANGYVQWATTGADATASVTLMGYVI